MEKCIYNGKILYAEEVKEEFTDEKDCRAQSTKRQFFCYDDECGKNVYYKRGEVKKAHFAHEKSDVQCDYDNFYKKTKRQNLIVKMQ